MTRKNSSILASVSLLFLLAGCAPSLVRSELYFGLSRQGSADVTPAEWQAFVDEVITPRFPNGLTVLEGNGQWQMRDGSLAKEKSRIVILVHPGTTDQQKKLDEIRQAYKKKFSQEAVMELDESIDVQF